MARSVLSALFLAHIAYAAPRDLTGYTFGKYVAEHGKSYVGEEWRQREALFNNSLAKVITHNLDYAAGRVLWWLDVNRLADMTPAEFAQLRSAIYPRSALFADARSPLGSNVAGSANPEHVDWREKGVVTQVKNQGGCGSCWAFSAAEALESHYAIHSGKLLQLSPQAIVDCVVNPDHCGGAGGCRGATMELAFQLAQDRGIPLESDLPYVGRSQSCHTYKGVVRPGGFASVPSNDAEALETALATAGPVSIYVAAMPWQVYGGGIFQGCSQPLPDIGNELDHGVLAVGYGVDAGHGYWLVRNSWGPGWGEDGYIRVSRASDSKTFKDDAPSEGSACRPYPKTQMVGGECGILFQPSYPTFDAVGPISI